ncbi:hypothetical protein M758_1G258400 [Ceratodon purpureus]|uniref:OPA3-like protein n=1 Tax=Ceratodon purpureus TaxID=3225 RepID=A0A8T0JD08_CERPU|nr:hypothetical protein KC19_1G265000 [Ceratodon purpureus]KAG0631498.1 hypothetical protein M758_1G258400 [Ceratodon purpureus]
MQPDILAFDRLLSTLHRFQVNLQRRIYGHDTGVVIHPLNPERAVQAASDLLGEFIIFGVGGTIVILEVQRNARSEALREAKMRAELEALQEKDRCASTELEHLRMRIDELEKAMSQVGRTSWSPPSLSILRKSSDQSQEVHRRSLAPPSNQNNTTTEKAPQN